MKEVAKIADESLYIEARDILKIANQAVKKAKAENKKLGIPEVFSKNGVLYYVLKNGEVTKKRPQIFQD